MIYTNVQSLRIFAGIIECTTCLKLPTSYRDSANERFFYSTIWQGDGSAPYSSQTVDQITPQNLNDGNKADD